MIFNDYNDFDEINQEIDNFESTVGDHQVDSQCCQPSCICMMIGIKVMKSAIHFENTLADYLKCQCRIIRRLIRNEQYELIDDILKEMSDSLHQIYNIESQILTKLEKGAILSNCIEPEG